MSKIRARIKEKMNLFWDRKCNTLFLLRLFIDYILIALFVWYSLIRILLFRWNTTGGTLQVDRYDNFSFKKISLSNYHQIFNFFFCSFQKKKNNSSVKDSFLRYGQIFLRKNCQFWPLIAFKIRLSRKVLTVSSAAAVKNLHKSAIKR